MIFGIGTDLVDIRRITKSLEKTDALAQRILTAKEYLSFEQRLKNSQKVAHAYLAKRFAAKEAVVKAFGTGFTNGLSLQDIEISNKDTGQPEINYYHKAQKFIDENHIKHSYISLSDEQHYVIAYVILSL